MDTPPSRTRSKPSGSLGGKRLELVLTALAGDILGGHYAPGEVLPREDVLLARFDISRTTLREAIKVLSAKGLLETRQRVGAIVRPHDDWNLLDPAVLAWHPDIRAERKLITDLLEVRRIIEPAAAELAAVRAAGIELVPIERALREMESVAGDDPRAASEADLAFHAGIFAASGNDVLRRIGGSIEATLGAAMMSSNASSDTPAEALASHREIMERIRLRDGAGARAAMNRMLDIAAKDLGQESREARRSKTSRPPRSAASATSASTGKGVRTGKKS